MAKGFYRDIVKALREMGYAQIKGGKGSHEKWQCQRTDRIVLIPRNLKSKHTANSILRGIGSDKRI